jgi:single-stranded-DNA-specific exonuclease
LKELIKVSAIDPCNCTVQDVGFRIAPRINANGRVSKAELALDLLHCEDEDEAFEIAIKIDALNEKRKIHQKKIFNEALSKIKNQENKHGILVYDEKWKSGVVGIVASKLVEKFEMPALVFGGEGNGIKGSGRSVDGINIKTVLDSISHLFSRYGGHEMAVGASLKNDLLSQAIVEFDKAVCDYKKNNKIEGRVVEYDIKLKLETFKKIDDKFCNNIYKFYPFGQGNKNIMFRVDGVKCESVKEWKSGTGGFADIDGLNMDCFIYGENSSNIEGQTIDILFQIEKNFKDDEEWAIAIREYGIK